MRGNELLDKMELIDPAYVEAADKKPRKQPGWVKWGAAAACLCLVIAGTLLLRGGSEKESLYTAEAEVPQGAAAPKEGVVHDMVPESDSSPLISMIAPDPDEPQVEACYASPPNGMVHYSVPLAGALASYGTSVRYNVVVYLFKDEVLLESGDEAVMREMERLQAAGYTVQYETEDSGSDYPVTCYTLHAQMSQLAEFDANEEYGYMLFFHDEVFKAGDTISITPKAGVNRAYAGLEDARNDEDFGAYLPDAVPSGYVEESIRRYKDPNNNYLSGTWTKGYDQLDWQVYSYTEQDANRLTGIDETENYDLSLYPIPPRRFRPG